jgi:hypothetical protein
MSKKYVPKWASPDFDRYMEVNAFFYEDFLEEEDTKGRVYLLYSSVYSEN